MKMITNELLRLLLFSSTLGEMYSPERQERRIKPITLHIAEGEPVARTEFRKLQAKQKRIKKVNRKKKRGY